LRIWGIKAGQAQEQNEPKHNKDLQPIAVPSAPIAQLPLLAVRAGLLRIIVKL